MPNPPPPAPIEKFATLIRCISLAAAARSAVGALSLSVIALIVGRLRTIDQGFARIAARLRDGTYAPRRSTPRRKPETPRPREPQKLPRKFGWLLPLLPDGNGYRSQLEYLFRDPEFAALVAAAPISLGRPLRALCWMLRVTPPENLAPPKRPRPPAKPRPAKPKPEPPPPPRRWPPLDSPAWMQNMPSNIKIPYLRRTRRSPKPA